MDTGEMDNLTEQNRTEQNRDITLDILRGIAILIVVLGHSIQASLLALIVFVVCILVEIVRRNTIGHGCHFGVRPHKEKINKTRGAEAPYAARMNHTPLRGEQQATVL